MPPTEMMVDLLGGTKVLGRSIKTDMALADAITRGLPEQSLEHVQSMMRLTNAEIGELLGISEKTVSRLRRSRKSTLSAVASDRLYRLARIIAAAKELTPRDEVIAQWLREPQVGLYGRVPLEMIRTEIGALEVEDELGRIRSGIPM